MYYVCSTVQPQPSSIATRIQRVQTRVHKNEAELKLYAALRLAHLGIVYVGA